MVNTMFSTKYEVPTWFIRQQNTQNYTYKCARHFSQSLVRLLALFRNTGYAFLVACVREALRPGKAVYRQCCRLIFEKFSV
jgi:hypothetical protein